MELQTKGARPEQGSSPSPLRSAEAFDSYCVQVQSRLAEHAAQRIHFLQSAFERLTRLLHTARDVEDTSLYNELWQHRVAVRELLEALTQVGSSVTAVAASAASSSASAAVSTSLPASGLNLADGGLAGNKAASSAPLYSPASSPATADKTSPDKTGLDKTGSDAAASAPGTTYPGVPLPAKSLPHPSGAANGHAQRDPDMDENDERSSPNSRDYNRDSQYDNRMEPAPRPLRHPVRPLMDIETDAAELRKQLRDWANRFPLRTASGNLHVPNCLRLRAMACRQRRLEEEAGDTEVEEVTELSKDIVDILDRAGDEEYTVALDYDVEPPPTAFQWGELAERYDETATAEEAFEWWVANRAILSVSDVQQLAESVAAIQQRFNRLLFRIGARDPFQQQLFDDLRVWAKEAQCYLYSLRPKVPIAELIEKAQMIDEAWEQAREPVRALEERQQSVDAVVDMVAAPGFRRKRGRGRITLAGRADALPRITYSRVRPETARRAAALGGLPGRR